MTLREGPTFSSHTRHGRIDRLLHAGAGLVPKLFVARGTLVESLTGLPGPTPGD